MILGMQRGAVSDIFGDLERWANDHHDLALEDLLRFLGERGAGLVAVVFAIPFLQPVPLFGLSTVFGAVLMALGLAIFLERRPRLPRFLAQRRVPASLLKTLSHAGLKVFRFVERFARPRGEWLVEHPSFSRFSGLVIFLSAFLLALPLPIPGTNPPPAAAIFFLSLGYLERDGILVGLGYAAFVGTLVYFGFLAWASKWGVESLLALF